MFLRKCEDAYFILQNKYVCIHEDSFGAKIHRDDCVLILHPDLTLIDFIYTFNLGLKILD